MWLSAVVAALVFQSASAPGTDFEADGLRALEQKNYSVAIEALTKAIAAEPGSYTAHFNLALAYSLSARGTEAIAEYRRTLELKPGLYQANLNLGILLLEAKQAGAALSALREARGARPAEFRPAYYLGETLLASGKPAEAAPEFEAALKIDPKSAAAELGLARALARGSQLSAAGPHFERAAQLDPAYSDALLELADLYQGAKQYDEAAAIYDRFPNNAAAQERVGEILLTAGKHAEAIPHLETAVRLSPSSANRLALATAYFGKKELDKGVEVLNQALTADPDNYDLRMLAGRVLRDQKQYPKAVTQFASAVKIKPESLDAWNEAAASLMLADDYPRAMAALDKLKSLGGETPSHYYLRAIMFDKLKQYPPALDYYQRFLAASGGKFPDEEFKSRQRARIIQRELSKR